MTAEVLGTASPANSAAWIPDDTEFGARLALIRQRMSWGNVKEAALACGLPPESWRTWERDNVSPRNYPTICRQIAVRTGCDLGWLMGSTVRRSVTDQSPVSSPTRLRSNRPKNRVDPSRPAGTGRRAALVRSA